MVMYHWSQCLLLALNLDKQDMQDIVLSKAKVIIEEMVIVQVRHTTRATPGDHYTSKY